MNTERFSPRYRGLDTWNDDEVLGALLDSQFDAVAALRPALPTLRDAAQAAVPRLEAGGRLIYVGAGASGRLAGQDGAELFPTFGWPLNRLVLLLAGGDAAWTRSIEGAEDDGEAAVAAVAALEAGADDVMVGVAASGRTPYTLAAIEEGRKRAALTIGIAHNQGAPLLRAAEHPILLDTGAEPIAGSTRMKAGTAQKIVLNLFSTLVMTRLGHVHDGLMVDMQPTNRKLTTRSIAMTRELTGCDEPAAVDALEHCAGNVKLAVLYCRGLAAEDGEALLAEHGGRLRLALASLKSGDGVSD